MSQARKIITVSFISLFLTACSTARLAEVPFQKPATLSLSDEDKADILEIARLVSDKRIEKVTLWYALPSSSVNVFVRYESDTVDTYVIDTTLQIYEKNTRYTITRGKWGTKPDLLRRDVLRVFNIDETRITLNVPDGMSYEEMRRLLQAVKNNEIIWEEQRFIKDFAVEDISRVTLEGSEPLYVVSIVKQHSPPGYFVYGRLEGAKLVVKRTDMAIP